MKKAEREGGLSPTLVKKFWPVKTTGFILERAGSGTTLLRGGYETKGIKRGFRGWGQV